MADSLLSLEFTPDFCSGGSSNSPSADNGLSAMCIRDRVYLCCTADGSHQGTGVVTAVEAEGKYKVEVTGGEFCMDETVGIFRKPGYPSSSRIGRGTVAATAAVAVKGSGSILKMHVANGDMVERGELLFETVEGTLDGLFSPGNEVLCDVTGIVSNIDAAAGTAVELSLIHILFHRGHRRLRRHPVRESLRGDCRGGEELRNADQLRRDRQHGRHLRRRKR